MTREKHSSKQRFVAFKKRLNEPVRGGDMPPLESGRKSMERSRSFGILLRAFFKMVGGNRKSLFSSLFYLTIGATIGLIPPAATKIVFDNILDDAPLPVEITTQFPFLANKQMLLAAIAIGTVLLAMISLAFLVRARWVATRTTKRIQVSIYHLDTITQLLRCHVIYIEFCIVLYFEYY